MIVTRSLTSNVNLVVMLAALGFSPVALAQSEVANAGGITYTILHTFSGTDGANPSGVLVQGTNGNFYGTTASGGANCAAILPCGTIFKMTPTGTLTTLYSFCAQSGCTDGQFAGGLIEAADGYLYGTTYGGGPYGGGTVFKITPGGKLTTIYGFCAQGSACMDGNAPSASLVQAASGDFYGTTYGGGAYDSGTIFKITPNGTLTTLYSFCPQAGCPDGELPSKPLVQASNGDLYGITTAGGVDSSSCPSGCGTIFKITPTGSFTTLQTAQGLSNFSGLVQASNGYLYGLTSGGGAYGGGTVFKMTHSGELTTIYSFCSQAGCPDGSAPYFGLIPGANGNLYGATLRGGAANAGTFFEITPHGTLTTLYLNDPLTGLVQSTYGIFYGTGEFGRIDNPGWLGAIYAFSTGQAPFVETLPTIGVAGEEVSILGYGLAGTTNVTFNGTPATILYDAPTVIYAKVPAGATTGIVKVTTPGGTLTSNVAFEVLP